MVDLSGLDTVNNESELSSDIDKAIELTVVDNALSNSESEVSAHLLKAERAKKGLSISEVFRATNIPEAYIQAIEEQRYGDISVGDIYVTGYIRSYACFLELDADDIVSQYRYERLLESGASKRDSSEQGLGNANVAQGGGGLDYGSLPSRIELGLLRLIGILKQVKIAVALILMAMFLVYKLLQVDEVPNASFIEDVKILGADGSVTVETLMQEHDPISVISPANQQLPLSDQKLIGVNEQQIAVKVMADAASTGLASEEAAQVAEKTIQFNFSETSWITVKDANNLIVHQSQKVAGDKLELSGLAPFHVKLGFAPAVKIEMNGRNIDFSQHIRRDSSTAELTLN